MARGEKVIVRDCRGRKLLRVVWADMGAGVLLCTEDGYRQAEESGMEPICVGFPKDDVTPKRYHP